MVVRPVVLVTGSRVWVNRTLITRVLSALPSNTLIVHGAAPHGADAIADEVAEQLHLDLIRYPAEWRDHTGCHCPESRLTCRYAGPRRNELMLVRERPDLVIAFRARGPSLGTTDMIRRARRWEIPVRIFTEDQLVLAWRDLDFDIRPRERPLSVDPLQSP